MLINGAASSPLSALGRKGLFSLCYKGLQGNAKGVRLTVSCHLHGGCRGRRGSRGFETHSNFGTSCPSLILSSFLWLSWSSWFFCSLQPHCEHSRSCILLGGPLLKCRHYLNLRQFTFLSSLFSTLGKCRFLELRNTFLAALSLLLALISFAMINGQMLLAQQGHRSLWTAALIIGFGRQYLTFKTFLIFLISLL